MVERFLYKHSYVTSLYYFERHWDIFIGFHVYYMSFRWKNSCVHTQFRQAISFYFKNIFPWSMFSALFLNLLWLLSELNVFVVRRGCIFAKRVVNNV